MGYRKHPVAYKCTPFLQPSTCMHEQPIFSCDEIFSYLGSEVVVLLKSSEKSEIRGTLMAFDCQSNILLTVLSPNRDFGATLRLLEIPGEQISGVSKL